MTTTLLPPTPSPPRATAGETRFVPVHANLMPDEVLSARQVVVVRKQVLLGLVVVLIVLIGWFGLSWWQTHSAESNLSDLQRQGLALQSQQSQFTPLVQAQAHISDIRTELGQLMIGDLSWKSMMTTIRDKAPAGVQLDSIAGSITAGTTTLSGADVLNQTGSVSIGTLTISGSAPDKRTVAAYADALAKVKGLAAPLISAVQGETRPLTFSISSLITSDALGGKYSTGVTGTPGSTGGN
jgi:Tfp pilus assembly protein PilN